MSGRPTARTPPTWARLVVMAVAAVLAGLLAAVAVEAGSTTLDGAPVALVAPDAVAEPFAEDVADATDGVLAPVAQPDPDAAGTALAEGAVAAVLDVDLRGTTDALVLAPLGSDRARRTVEEQVAAVAASYGREVTVTEAPGRGAPVPAVLAALACLLGWTVVAVVSAVTGAWATSLVRGSARAGAVGLAGALAGVGGGLLSGSAEVGAVLLAATLAAGLTTLLAEALVGFAGLVAGAALVLAPALPLARATDPLLLPPGWRPVLDATAPGATTELLRQGPPALVDWSSLVLAGWVIVPLAALLVVRVAAARSVDVTQGPVPASRAAPLTRGARVTTTVVLLLVVVTVVLVRTAAPPTARTTPVADLAAGSSCEATGTVGGVRDLNRISRLRGRPEFQGGDVGVETRLQDGRVLWLFGDTLRSGPGGADFVRNSGLLVGDGCLRVVLAAQGGALVPDRDDGVGYWPMSVTTQEQPGYDVVTVLAQRVRTTGDDVFDFEALGPSVAVLVAPTGATPQVITVRDLTGDDADTARPMWGAASVVDDGWLYLYGTARPDDGSSFGFSLAIARVRPADVVDTDAWRFWDGAAWVTSAEDAAELVPAVGGTSQTLSVFRRGETWYAFSKRDEFLGSELVFWTAPSPTGPFTPAPPTADLPSDLAGGQLRYMPLAHPELFPEPGSVVVSYSRNSTDLGAVVDDPLLYRPRFLRLPLPPTS